MMEMFGSLLLLSAGFVMLVKGADWFVDGASSIAERFGIPQLIIGLTIVAMGTSAPEAAVSITAAIKGNADITIGNIIGSNILNILVILGISSVITALAVRVLFYCSFFLCIQDIYLLWRRGEMPSIQEMRRSVNCGSPFYGRPRGLG